MINKYGQRNGGQLYEDNCFHMSDQIKRNLKKIIMAIWLKREQDVHVKFDALDKDFLNFLLS